MLVTFLWLNSQTMFAVHFSEPNYGLSDIPIMIDSVGLALSTGSLYARAAGAPGEATVNSHFQLPHRKVYKIISLPFLC